MMIIGEIKFPYEVDNMKRLIATLAFVTAPAFAVEPDMMSNLVGLAQAAAQSPSAKSLVGQVVPGGLSAGVPSSLGEAVVQGGKVVAGAMPMALVCEKFQQPNACAEDNAVVSLEKFIIKKTGETSFVVERLEVNTYGTARNTTATIYFKLTP